MGESDCPHVIVLAAPTLDLLSATRDSAQKRTLSIRVGDVCERGALLAALTELGYERVPLVHDPGEFAVRGSVIDVFSPGESAPVRIDFFDDEVDSIRRIGDGGQRSGQDMEGFLVIPAREVNTSPTGRKRAQQILQKVAESQQFPTRRLRPFLDDLEAGIVPHRLEMFAGLFESKTTTIGHLLPPEGLVVVLSPDECEKERIAAREELHRDRRESLEAGRLTPGIEFRLGDPIPLNELGAVRIECPDIVLGRVKGPLIGFQCRSVSEVTTRIAKERMEQGGLGAFVSQAQRWMQEGKRVVVVCSSAGGQERIRALLEHHRLDSSVFDRPLRTEDLCSDARGGKSVCLLHGELNTGFELEMPPLVVLSEAEVIGSSPKRRRKQTRRSQQQIFQAFGELQIGGHVVHVDHGLARYEGLARLAINGVDGDFLDLRFKGEDRLYLPIHRMDKVQRYVGADEDLPTLDRLGGTSWEKTKARVKRDLWELAEHLVAVEAKRRFRKISPCPPIDEDYRNFEAEFPYVPTEDQEATIEQIMADLEKDTPMDRLVCGDVGFGKTEVAIRAAFRVAQAGGQVAVLVPTTILAEQHLRTFRKRMDAFAVEVRGLSRFQRADAVRDTREGLVSGRVDVVVGTHRILSESIQFKRLRLVIVDEEHRFGVRHKERLKELKENVHVLTLTATPIPRTLHLALSGVRELSTIATPPADRLSVFTLVHKQRDDVIEEAIRRELVRGGRVFYIHNRVATIATCAERIERLVPEARIVVGHAQMNERKLESAMRAFVDGEANVLVSTTIVENGLDIPEANTLVVERADRFGLADLYQLRGRVGRGSVRAYAYFLIPERERITVDAATRLEAIRSITGLGGGFQVAQRDLEIRGAGNILGKQQSGQINAIGYDLYAQLLEEAMARLQGEESPEPVDTEVQISIAAFLPEEYCPDTPTRLRFYKDLADARESDELDRLFDDLVDLCGRPPQEVTSLFESTRLKLRAQAYRIQKITYSRSACAFEMDESAEIEPARVLEFLACRPAEWRLSPRGNTILRAVTEQEFREGISGAVRFLDELVDGLSLPKGEA